MYNGAEKLVSKLLFVEIRGVIDRSTEQDRESDLARYGLRTQASSPTVGSVSGNGRSGVGDMWISTVPTESTELGLLVLLSDS